MFLWLLLLLWGIKSSVSDPGVLCLWPAFIELWQVMCWLAGRIKWVITVSKQQLPNYVQSASTIARNSHAFALFSLPSSSHIITSLDYCCEHSPTHDPSISGSLPSKLFCASFPVHFSSFEKMHTIQLFQVIHRTVLLAFSFFVFSRSALDFFLLSWVFAACGLSLVATRGAPVHRGEQASHCGGFSHGAQALGCR